VGLMFGSFINLAADRLPRGESLVRPRSHCRACGRPLDVIDLLPIVGYVVRGGRCATCRAPIGLAAPVVEVIAGAAILGPILWLGLWPGSVVGLALVALWGAIVVGLSARRITPLRSEPARPGSRPDRASERERLAP
jgi:prepilin signal peptidase PulO-like enzyme (type II secretory pathway)